jgi:hypothetical protein
VDRKLLVKLLCVALVAAVMMPAGHVLFPYLSHVVSSMQFHALEAIGSTSAGFGLSAILG